MDILYIALVVLPLIVFAIIALIIVKKSYVVCGVDEVLFRCGVGGCDVITAGGMLVIPMLHNVQIAKLHAVPIAEEFPSSSPITFQDGTRVSAEVEFWVRYDTTQDALLEAFQEFGDKISDGKHIQRYIGKNFREALLREAKKSDLIAWSENPKEFCWKVAIEDLGESFLMVSQVTVATES